MPTILSQTGLPVQLQLVELTDEYVLIRLRGNDLHASGHHGTQIPIVMDEWFTLEDAQGSRCALVQKSSGGGPFIGQVDLAFTRAPETDFGAELTLSSENVHLIFAI
ncbi:MULTISPECIES: hypothetical protein [unclassified Cryobacterium]|uniref:hypothetical protein n=1 Tax=unclassified Cryobacterium TaxID=2649013 RepID=UPI002AB55212|nr:MULTISPECIES: hypothetical protein [unclassified Cryobacterium]MDY7530039.1 hypothetical protein [Cryobacterium sp. 10C2]MDY7555313.1 hypothetical protein [Cryobacterium sp. 10C3]MEB0290594.1 hypothetical protein [Cryobacterium sp. 10C2]